ncbi:unnamed protein product [Calypogeia fissa]
MFQETASCFLPPTLTWVYEGSSGPSKALSGIKPSSATLTGDCKPELTERTIGRRARRAGVGQRKGRRGERGEKNRPCFTFPVGDDGTGPVEGRGMWSNGRRRDEMWLFLEGVEPGLAFENHCWRNRMNLFFGSLASSVLFLSSTGGPNGIDRRVSDAECASQGLERALFYDRQR